MSAPCQADALILFGISGDLARKKLFAALYDLTEAGHLDMPVIGVASRPWDDETLRTQAKEALINEGRKVDEKVFSRLAANLTYCSGNYKDPDTFKRLAERVKDRKCAVSYLAIPPGLFESVVEGLAGVGLHKSGRLVLEKPFGRDLASAQELDEIVRRYYPEVRVYRIDHFHGKEAVQNLMIFRFSNTVLEPIWNRHYVRGVQITMAEEFGIEGRGSFYDKVGAVRDVVQNHLLQVLALLAMEPPVSESPDALRDERVKALRAIVTPGPEDVVRGQFEGYRDEYGVASDSDTETYAAIRLQIDSWRWAGVPWIIRAGKGLASTVTEAVVEFARPPRPLFADSHCRPGPNQLTFRTKPDDGISLSMQAKKPGPEMVSRPIDLEVHREQVEGRDAYDRLLGDALRGDPSLFARADGVMEAWRVVDDTLRGCKPVVPYKCGSWGPDEAKRLLGPDWNWVTP